MKKILITSTDVMMYLFLIPHIKVLANTYNIDVACSGAKEFDSEDYEKKIRQKLPKNVNYFHISSDREPFSFNNIKGYKELTLIIKNGGYDMVWTNEPVVGVITRLASNKFRKNGLKVMYLVHGYHFFKGAPTMNWIFYPVEKLLSYITDISVVINWDDFNFAKKHFSDQVVHIDGIGFNSSKFRDTSVDFKLKRQTIGISEDEILILSVGELMTRKNHEVIIKAIAQLDNPKIRYVICGIGPRLEYLERLTKKLNIIEKVKFLGLRNDVNELLKVADIFAHPSKREGLGIAPLEAMASGLPIITSNTQGIKDYSENEVTGFCLDCNDISGFAVAISKLSDDKALCKKIGRHNAETIIKWDIKNSISQVKYIIKNLLNK